MVRTKVENVAKVLVPLEREEGRVLFLRLHQSVPGPKVHVQKATISCLACKIHKIIIIDHSLLWA